jgi:preprotein translocase subunit YajC
MTSLLLPLYILIFLVLIWFVGIRPQQKRRREQQQLMSKLSVGDEIVTMAGLYGTVTEIEDGETILLEVAEDVDVRIAKASIAKRITPEVGASEAPAPDGAGTPG